ncbi:early nodulin-like protein 12 [Bidens hawaiensis]|uniref:early nodulin-like protein 12 n=1 Tax=Bidens hawaiensis TaxID=980011 RepID=UPI0040493DED
MATVKLLVALFILTVVSGWILAGAQVVHHVVPFDRDSNTSTDVGSWPSGRVFQVGDSLSFKYFLPHEIFVELASMEEYHSCNLTNPIKMYTDVENQVALVEEGVRYFASGSYDKCKNGAKLHVPVGPLDPPGPFFPFNPPPSPPGPFGPFDQPPPPSSATQLNSVLALSFIGLFVYGLC